MRFDHVFDLALDCPQSQLGEVTVQVWMGGYPGSLCAWYAILLHSGYNERAFIGYFLNPLQRAKR